MSTEHLAGKPGDEPREPINGEVLPPQQEQPASTEIEIEDVDDIELRTAMADVGAEEPEGQLQPAEEEGDPKQNPPTPAGSDPAQDGEQPKGSTQSIPKARFDEVLARSKIAEENFAKERAQRLAAEQELAKHRPPAVNPDLLRIDAQIDELAEKFDKGEILYKDMKAQERLLQDQRDRIREEQIVQRATERAAASAPAASSGDDGWLAERSAEVVNRYGSYIEAIPEFMVPGVVEQARANLIAEHGRIPNGPRGDAMLREEFGRLAEKGHAGFAAISGKTVTATGNGQQQRRPTPGDQPTPEQRRAKLALQTQAPPSISDMQRSTGSDTDLSDAAIEEMDEEAIAALPAATRNRLLGIS